MNEIPYTAEEIQKMRRKLAELRGEALDQGQMQWAIILSHTITVLWDYTARIHNTLLEELPMELGRNT